MKIVELSARIDLLPSSKSTVTFQRNQNLLSSAAILLLHFCLLDASNIQPAKSSLLFDALLVNDGGNNPTAKDLLLQLNDTNFDCAMTRVILSLSIFL